MMDDIPTRVAVLEQIAKNTEATLSDIRDEMRAGFRLLIERQDRDFRYFIVLYLSGMAILLGVMAHGFKWI